MTKVTFAAVAQLAEQVFCKHQVVGSTPTGGYDNRGVMGKHSVEKSVVALVSRDRPSEGPGRTGLGALWREFESPRLSFTSSTGTLGNWGTLAPPGLPYELARSSSEQQRRPMPPKSEVYRVRLYSTLLPGRAGGVERLVA